MSNWHRSRLLALSLAMVAVAAPARAVNLVLNYSYDTSNFFGAGNPNGLAAGLQAKAALESAAGFFSNILNDTLSSIQTPPTFHSSVFEGQATWEWTMNFDHPGNGSPVVVTNPTVPADQYIVFAGARSLSGVEAGQGGPGGYSWSYTPTGRFTIAEGTQLESITAQFEYAVERRGEPSGFARWGGTITFDRDASTTWHYNHTTQPSGNVIDFYSVAIHELGHALGFGSSDEFQALVSGSTFTGENARALNGGANVPLSADHAHWNYGTTSVVYGSSTTQEVAMDPDLLNGTRKRFTALDAAGLKDIGWEVIPLPGVNGDYNNNGVVDAADYAVWRDKLNQSVTIPNDPTPGMVTTADYTVWRTNFGKTPTGGGAVVNAGAVPEPTGGLLTAIGFIVALYARRRRRG